MTSFRDECAAVVAARPDATASRRELDAEARFNTRMRAAEARHEREKALLRAQYVVESAKRRR